MLLPSVYRFIGGVSIGTLHRWVKAFEDYGTNALLPQYKYTQQKEYNSKLTEEMKNIFLKYLLHPNQFNVGKAIKLTKHILEKRGYENIPCNLTFRRFADHYKKVNYSQWIMMREGEKAYHDKVEAYIERDISVLNVGDVLIADGHVLNFQVINPFTGKPTRATLVGFLDWKSTALVGYEIMMSENTQCIASALRNAIINLGVIPKVVYQDNGKAFKAKYFQSSDFDEAGIGDGISLAYPNSKKRRGRVGKGCSQTLDTSCHMGVIDSCRIRRLTPLECFRLQGFPDEMVKVARSLKLSDCRLYKMAGNAVTVNVVEEIARRIAELYK